MVKATLTLLVHFLFSLALVTPAIVAGFQSAFAFTSSQNKPKLQNQKSQKSPFRIHLTKAALNKNPEVDGGCLNASNAAKGATKIDFTAKKGNKCNCTCASKAALKTTTKLQLTAQASTDCDNVNTPPSLTKIQSSIHSIKSGSDIRGTFVDHSRVGSILNVSSAVSSMPKGSRILTPFAAYCYGAAFAKMVQIRAGKGAAVQQSASFANDLFPTAQNSASSDVAALQTTNICVGRDPRPSGIRMADAFCRGVESVDGAKAHYTNLASTPSMFAFCRSHLVDCDGGVMVTASHLPTDRNGFKFFTTNGGLTKKDIEILAESASNIARSWFDLGIIPQTSGYGAVYCSDFVDYMPIYMDSLRNAIFREVYGTSVDSNRALPLEGLRVVLNAGNGAGYFFNQVLEECGADVSNSIHLVPDGSFPERTGVPNPEYKPMMEETIEACQKCDADIGIMLDTDADRCGFVVPLEDDGNSKTRIYKALNRNRLIALLGVIFSSSSPGCTIVTDSVTSEGLASFLTDHLGINHVRYLKGYANVIGKAKELTESGKALAEVAIETSGHCAMRENGYLDDGTYTAVKVVSLLAKIMKDAKEEEKRSVSLFNLISELKELDEVNEFRMEVSDGSIDSTKEIFNQLRILLQAECKTRNEWELDEQNLEGVRIRIEENGFFMLRMSLHDPILSLLIEGKDRHTVESVVLHPILDLITNNLDADILDSSVLENYMLLSN